MLHLGDITKIKGAEIPVVDVITGGSPCQDLSVAGKRAGLEGERSGLFMEQIRIIKEMREHDKSTGRRAVDIRPRYMVWENVDGARSSPAHSHRAAERTSASSSKKQQGSQIRMPQFLDLRSGHRADASWEMGGQLLGDYMMHSFGELPRDGVASRLSQILEASPHPRYSLSARACAGILARANRRGKTLPSILETALTQQATPLKCGGGQTLTPTDGEQAKEP